MGYLLFERVRGEGIYMYPPALATALILGSFEPRCGFLVNDVPAFLRPQSKIYISKL